MAIFAALRLRSSFDYEFVFASGVAPCALESMAKNGSAAFGYKNFFLPTNSRLGGKGNFNNFYISQIFRFKIQ